MLYYILGAFHADFRVTDSLPYYIIEMSTSRIDGLFWILNIFDKCTHSEHIQVSFVDLRFYVHSRNKCVQCNIRAHLRCKYDLRVAKCSKLILVVQLLNKQELVESLADLVDGDGDVYVERRGSSNRTTVRITSTEHALIEVLYNKLRQHWSTGFSLCKRTQQESSGTENS